MTRMSIGSRAAMAAAALLWTVTANVTAGGGGEDFRAKDGVFAPSGTSGPAVVGRSEPQGGAAGAACARQVSGLLNPGAVLRHGDLLYVTNNHNNTTNLITVIDIGVVGDERIVGEIVTPTNPVDIEIAGDDLYVIDQTRDTLYWRPLAGGNWSSLPLPSAQTTEWEYGNIMYAHEGRLFVLHFWENLISVVDLDTKSVVSTINDLSFLPNRIVFLDEVMIVLSVGLAEPSCAAAGPHYSVFDLKTLARQYSQDISGDCPLTCGVLGDRFYVVFNNSVREYDLATGSQLNAVFAPPFFGRHMAADNHWLYVQRPGGAIGRSSPDLPKLDSFCNVLVDSQVWFPPVEQMTLDSAYTRLFIANRNDNTVSIIDLDLVECPADLSGDGQVGVVDLLILLTAWGPCPNAGDCPEDLTGDGEVGVADLLALLSAWGPCP